MDDLLRRLRTTLPRYNDDNGVSRFHANPDGPEAADRIDALQAENERLKEGRDTWAKMAHNEAVAKQAAALRAIAQAEADERARVVHYLLEQAKAIAPATEWCEAQATAAIVWAAAIEAGDHRQEKK